MPSAAKEIEPWPGVMLGEMETVLLAGCPQFYSPNFESFTETGGTTVSEVALGPAILVLLLETYFLEDISEVGNG